MNLSKNILRLIDDDPAAKMAVESLSPFGEVYVVGGAPRDIVLGKKPKDIDIMAKVNGDTIESVLKSIPKAKLSLTGKQFPVYRFNYAGSEVEIALPRIEVKTGEGNKDWQIKSDSSIPVEKDLERRDFTANAIAVNAKTGKVVDPFDGLKDIENGVLKTVHPNSFRDDSSRTMRALTALSKHGLQPDEETKEQMRLHAPHLKKTPMEIVGQELEKVLSGDYPAEAIRLGHETGVLDHFLPEVHSTFGFDQKNPYHKHDLGTHTMNVLKNVSGLTGDTDVRMAALLHDIGKPASMWEDENGVGHFYKGEQGQGANHDEVGAEMAEGILSKLRYPANRIGRIKHIINNHMFPSFNSPKGARKFLNNAGSLETAHDLINVREADHMGKGNENATRMMTDKMRSLINDENTSQSVFSPKDLAVDGNDIIKTLGISSGPQVGEVIKKLMDLVVDHPSLNNRQELLNIVKTFYPSKVSSEIKFAASVHPDFHTGISKTFEEGQGFTWNEDFSGYNGKGFGVGLNDHGTAINIKHFDADDVKRFKNEHSKFLSKNQDVKIGSWNDTKDNKGLVYLDLVKMVPDELEALRLAQKEQQIAFYDFGSGRVINTQPDIAHEYPIDRDEDDPNPEHLQENYDVNAMRY
jgi:tRNA nucleotidyltransferase (CCA-adding enzyme)